MNEYEKYLLRLEREKNRYYHKRLINDERILKYKLYLKHPGLTCYGCKFKECNSWGCKINLINSKHNIIYKDDIRACSLFTKRKIQ